VKGHIRKRAERSRAVVLDLGPDPETGRRRQKWHTVHGTKRDAQRALASLLTELHEGRYVEPSQETLGSYLARWLADYARPNVADKTFVGYEINVRRHIVPHLGRQRLGRLKPSQIQGLYTALLASGLSNKTVRYIHQTLHVALKHAVKWGHLAVNPSDSVEPPRVTPRELTVWRSTASRDSAER
jgi:hypothetical protein